ncbi:MAG: winged helix-turn-helix domain-containing protein [Candidatus Helarchaeota archaeon]
MPKKQETIWNKLTEDELIDFLKLKASEVKLKILRLLLENEGKDQLYQAQIAKKVKRTSTGTRFHLKEMEKLNLINREKKNRYVYYKITENGKRIYEKIKEYL